MSTQQIITRKLSETFRGKPEGSRHSYRYVTCTCGKKLNIGGVREINRELEQPKPRVLADCNKCGTSIRIVKG